MYILLEFMQCNFVCWKYLPPGVAQYGYGLRTGYLVVWQRILPLVRLMHRSAVAPTLRGDMWTGHFGAGGRGRRRGSTWTFTDITRRDCSGFSGKCLLIGNLVELGSCHNAAASNNITIDAIAPQMNGQTAHTAHTAHCICFTWCNYVLLFVVGSEFLCAGLECFDVKSYLYAFKVEYLMCACWALIKIPNSPQLNVDITGQRVVELETAETRNKFQIKCLQTKRQMRRKRHDAIMHTSEALKSSNLADNALCHCNNPRFKVTTTATHIHTSTQF